MNAPDSSRRSCPRPFLHQKRELETRNAQFVAWLKACTHLGLIQSVRNRNEATQGGTRREDDEAFAFEGLNLATSDYLGLSRHAQVRRAAQVAQVPRGHPRAQANAFDLRAHLAAGLSDFLQMEHVTIFDSGERAGASVVRTILTATDRVLLDAHVGSGLLEAARQVTPHVFRYRHGDVEHARRLLRRMRAQPSAGRILLATPGLSPCDGEAPDLEELRTLAYEFGALLLVDVSHDFGCIGPGGRGELGLQDRCGMPDVVVGSLSKTFASQLGFVATRAEWLVPAVETPSVRGDDEREARAALAAAVASLLIVRSPEGLARRAALQRLVLALRADLSAEGLRLHGHPSPVVPIQVGDENVARMAVRACAKRGILAQVVEHPHVARGAARLLLQLTAAHEPALSAEIARKVAGALAEARQSACDSPTSEAT